MSKWTPGLITVGGKEADISGFDSNAVQTAADALKARGGGTIVLSEGTFEVIGPIRLSDNMTLTGQGGKTRLVKTAGVSSAFAQDVDYGVSCARVADARGFRPGMGIAIRDGANSGGWLVSTSRILSVEGGTLHFDRRTVMDYTAGMQGTVTNACSIVEAIKAENVKISNLLIDGSKESNFFIDGCRGGGIYLHKASRCRVENVTVRNFCGDGISWQITRDITLAGTEVSGCAGFGLHPGTGSERSLVEGCVLRANGSDGMFVCWRVTNGIFRNNSICSNGANGINIGHRDSDNLFEGNEIRGNGRAGILFRKESEGNRAERNVFLRNTVEDNGGCGFLFECESAGTVIEGNTVRDTGAGKQLAGIARPGGEGWLSARNNAMGGHTGGDIEIRA